MRWWQQQPNAIVSEHTILFFSSSCVVPTLVVEQPRQVLNISRAAMVFQQNFKEQVLSQQQANLHKEVRDGCALWFSLIQY